MYVIRSTNEVPEVFEEYFYDEVVTIRNGIGLVRGEHVLQALTGGYNQYEFIGIIDSDKYLTRLLAKYNAREKDQKLGLEVRKKVLTMEDIIELEKPKEKPEPRIWIEKIDG